MTLIFNIGNSRRNFGEMAAYVAVQVKFIINSRHNFAETTLLATESTPSERTDAETVAQ
jgi:hypothetical protein